MYAQGCMDEHCTDKRCTDKTSSQKKRDAAFAASREGVKNLDRSDLDKTKYKSHLPGRNKQCDFSRLSDGSIFRLRIRAKAQAFQFCRWFANKDSHPTLDLPKAVASIHLN